eukprot:429492-Amorphochlora_amoeboformis.AAC.1
MKIYHKIAGNGKRGDVDGSSLMANFDRPMGITVAPNGVVYVSDFLNTKIKRIIPHPNPLPVSAGTLEILNEEQRNSLKKTPLSTTDPQESSDTYRSDDQEFYEPQFHSIPANTITTPDFSRIINNKSLPHSMRQGNNLNLFI